MSIATTAAELDDLLGSCAFTRHARLRVVALGDGWCELEVPFSPDDERPGGIVSGQVYVHPSTSRSRVSALDVALQQPAQRGRLVRQLIALQP